MPTDLESRLRRLLIESRLQLIVSLAIMGGQRFNAEQYETERNRVAMELDKELSQPAPSEQKE